MSKVYPVVEGRTYYSTKFKLLFRAIDRSGFKGILPQPRDVIEGPASTQLTPILEASTIISKKISITLEDLADLESETAQGCLEPDCKTREMSFHELASILQINKESSQHVNDSVTKRQRFKPRKMFLRDAS